ncbi:MAG: hypothetical protein BLM47_12075 [Candidatus Reconcilbacillus cellulovorans]|uniref:Uncharacterized protein n=1 Tax=Candidatus Reconcilbacillus cellulovorans TaxID=1906605 RepID=A0A2A6DXW2_9BACL|nr:MAG: hypothetical protein BLM47_12075 [Candidatus Reconcilbacillus cellulovorans]
MEEKLNQLMELVDKQNAIIEDLKKKIETLESMIQYLSICKVSNEKYPFYDFVLSYGITTEQQFQLRRLFLVLSEKLSGKSIPEKFREKESYSTDFLFRDLPIEFDDVKKAILKIWPVEDEQLPVLLIKAMKGQGMLIDVCDYLLSQIDEKKP